MESFMPIQLKKTVSREQVLTVTVLKENSKRFNGDSYVGDNWYCSPMSKTCDQHTLFSKLKSEYDEKSLEVIQVHLRSFKVKLWNFERQLNFQIFFIPYLTLKCSEWSWMTLNDLLSRSNFNLLQKMPDVCYVCNEN